VRQRAAKGMSSRAAGTVSASAKGEARASVTVDPALRSKAEKIRKQLDELHPDPPIPLDHESPFQLLCAVVLSAQTTDKAVNQITPELFSAAPNPSAMASLEVTRIQELIRNIGLYRNKAKFLSELSKKLVEDHNGEVPDTRKDLEALPGVGTKTASVILSQVHGIPSFPVDTHIHRLACRWGLSTGTTVKQVENDLKIIFPESEWNSLHLQIIYYGREHGQAHQKPPGKGGPPWPGPICSWAGLDNPPMTTPAKKRREKEEKKKGADGSTSKRARRKLL